MSTTVTGAGRRPRAASIVVPGLPRAGHRAGGYARPRRPRQGPARVGDVLHAVALELFEEVHRLME
jgi:hypothetical protein